jgi:hypothetical protein
MQVKQDLQGDDTALATLPSSIHVEHTANGTLVLRHHPAPPAPLFILTHMPSDDKEDGDLPSSRSSRSEDNEQAGHEEDIDTSPSSQRPLRRAKMRSRTQAMQSPAHRNELNDVFGDQVKPYTLNPTPYTLKVKPIDLNDVFWWPDARVPQLCMLLQLVTTSCMLLQLVTTVARRSCSTTLFASWRSRTLSSSSCLSLRGYGTCARRSRACMRPGSAGATRPSSSARSCSTSSSSPPSNRRATRTGRRWSAPPAHSRSSPDPSTSASRCGSSRTHLASSSLSHLLGIPHSTGDVGVAGAWSSARMGRCGAAQSA